MPSRRIVVPPLFLLLATAAAQETTFTTQTNLVLVPTLVTDHKGKIVYGLTVSDFVIEDDGVPQSVRLEEGAEAEPVSLVIAIQNGGRAAQEFSRIEGLSSLLDPVLSQPGAETAVITFDSNVNLVRDFTGDADVVEKELRNVLPGDHGAAILDAVGLAGKILERRAQGRQKVLLLVSETHDQGSHIARMEDVVAQIGDSNIAVYALAFSASRSKVLDDLRGRNRDEMSGEADLLAPLVMAAWAMRKNSPKAIASQTGGEYQLFSSRRSFESHMADFANHLQNRYLLSFEPKNPQPGLHRITVRLREPSNLSVLARSNYWVRR
jgi:VWFA-related protein